MRACDVDFQVVSSVVYQQISQSLDDISLINSSTTIINKTIISPYSSPKSQTLLSSVIKSPMNTSLTSSNAHMTVTIILQNDTTYTLLCENDYDMSCWSDGFNILLHKEMNSFYAQEEMELLLNLLCQLQILELDSPSIILPQYQLPFPVRF
ncbi:unnamed protein product, partial [Rotaria sp. Silwood1]